MTKTKSKSKTFEGEYLGEVIDWVVANIPTAWRNPEDGDFVSEKIIITVTRFVEEDKQQTK